MAIQLPGQMGVLAGLRLPLHFGSVVPAIALTLYRGCTAPALQEFIVKFRVQQALAALAHGQSAANQARLDACIALLACMLACLPAARQM